MSAQNQGAQDWIKKSKERDFLIVLFFGSLFLFGGIIFFRMNEIEAESSNIWITIHAIASGILVFIGSGGYISRAIQALLGCV
jgi:hypothetical protein